MAPPHSPPLAMQEWFQAIPEVLSSTSWELALARPKAQLWHRSCPWGGHLIKFDLKGMPIQDAPEKTGNLIVRPEVRAAMKEIQPKEIKIIGSEFIAPGEAILEGRTANMLFRLLTVLFGEMSELGTSYFFHDAMCPVAVHQKVRRDYPMEGDSSMSFWEEGGQTSHGIMVMRPESEKGFFNVIFVVRLPQDKFATWATFQFRCLLEIVYKTTHWFVNRPNIVKLREADEKFYVTLSIQSFKRGLPMVPCSSQPLVTIDAGEALGLRHWKRYRSDGNVRKCKFKLVEYLKILLNAIGEDIDAFDTLDGRELVSYQCVVRRSDWEPLRERFATIFRLAKAAYRRANGGTYAPSIHEDVEVKFSPQERVDDDWAKRSETEMQPRVVVRNTFLDFEEPQEAVQRPSRRSRTMKLNIPI